MTALKLNKFILLPEKTASALVHCGFAVSGELVRKTLFPHADRSYYEGAVREFLLRRFAETVRWYEYRPCPAGHLSAGSPVWVFLSGKESEKDDALLQSVCKEADNRPVCVITRENYRKHIILPCRLIKRLGRVEDDMLSELLCHALLSRQDGTYVDSRRWESARKGDPVHGFVFDMLAACLSARLPIVDDDLPGILMRMAECHIRSVRRKRDELDRMILQSCSLRTTGTGME